mmetsp:Transcript_85804/g.166265  ORF Transcript_85804/g.166265 Transcript_85804/m.166265 type:complete len:509 (+) Transcript_85804:5197-6723(+)
MHRHSFTTFGCASHRLTASPSLSLACPTRLCAVAAKEEASMRGSKSSKTRRAKLELVRSSSASPFSSWPSTSSSSSLPLPSPLSSAGFASTPDDVRRATRGSTANKSAVDGSIDDVVSPTPPPSAPSSPSSSSSSAASKVAATAHASVFNTRLRRVVAIRTSKPPHDDAASPPLPCFSPRPSSREGDLWNSAHSCLRRSQYASASSQSPINAQASRALPPSFALPPQLLLLLVVVGKEICVESEESTGNEAGDDEAVDADWCALSAQRVAENKRVGRLAAAPDDDSVGVLTMCCSCTQSCAKDVSPPCTLRRVRPPPRWAMQRIADRRSSNCCACCCPPCSRLFLLDADGRLPDEVVALPPTSWMRRGSTATTLDTTRAGAKATRAGYGVLPPFFLLLFRRRTLLLPPLLLLLPVPKNSASSIACRSVTGWWAWRSVASSSPPAKIRKPGEQTDGAKEVAPSSSLSPLPTSQAAMVLLLAAVAPSTCSVRCSSETFAAAKSRVRRPAQ